LTAEKKPEEKSSIVGFSRRPVGSSGNFGFEKSCRIYVPMENSDSVATLLHTTSGRGERRLHTLEELPDDQSVPHTRMKSSSSSDMRDIVPRLL
jgi:hypothetical protein